MATYPDNILVKGDVVNDVDVYDQADHNILKEEIIALETNIGTSPQGDRTNFMARYNAQFDGSGFIISSTGVPAVTAPRMLYYRTDEEQLYNVKTDGTVQSIGGSFANLLYAYVASLEVASSTEGEIQATGFTGLVNATSYYRFIRNLSTTTKTYLTGKFSKIAGISTIRVLGQIWQGDALGTCALYVDVGGQNAEATSVAAQTQPTYENFTIDVSGLANGTIFDISIGSRKQPDTNVAYIGNVFLFGE